MDTVSLDELKGRKKLQTLKLIEIMDITRRMAEALDRRDEVSVGVLLGEREQPIRELQEIEEGIQDCMTRLSENDAIRCAALLRGEPAETEEEQPLAEQVGQYRRTLESAIAQDKQLSLRLGGKQSFYNKFR